jgi:threonine aldolase
MDGARLMNAVVASGVPARDFCAGCDSAWLDLSKGLGAPIGAVLAGSAAFIAEARRYKHIFGGAMRQAGIIAAAGVYALEHHVARLADDHANARLLAEGLADGRRMRCDPELVETNIVFGSVLDGTPVDELIAEMAGVGVLCGEIDRRTVRFVTHLDVDSEAVTAAVERLRAMLR